ncbi:MAG: ribosome small subunit-dependent GTPase A [Lachnospiraceae bacterium]|nr:ribosome small subunit-dependent GTPase A [Lachnospiraceae bacterium]
MDNLINIKKYGFSEVFSSEIPEDDPLEPARVLSQEKGFYRVVTDNGEKLAEVSGKFRFQTTVPSEYPVVGDFVLVNWNESGNSAIIESLLPRKSAFIRKAAGESQQEQVVAANIDTVFLCMALNNDFNLRRLERYISIAWNSGAMPVVVLTKSDLCDDLENKLSEVSSIAFGIDILVTTSMEEDGYKELLPFISEGKTIAIIGSSGVGKSTMINRLLGKEYLKTNGLRNDDKGRHTTTRRELFLLPSGGMVIDTPGMREFGMWDNDTGIERTFTDIEELASQCKFRNCTHTNEPGCAIRSALTMGELQIDRWQSYQKLKAENDYIEDKESYMIAKGKREKEISKPNLANELCSLFCGIGNSHAYSSSRSESRKRAMLVFFRQRAMIKIVKSSCKVGKLMLSFG